MNVDAAVGDLGTPGPYFAGTACHCETTTTAEETVMFTQEGVGLISSRTSDGTTCTVRPVAQSLPVLVIRASGEAELTEVPPVLVGGIVFDTVGTWRCEQGSFRLDFAAHTRSGDFSRQFLVAPPQCQLFPCASGLRCSINAGNPVHNACVADGSLSEGVACNEDANCQSGLTCQGANPISRVCE